MMRLFDWQHKDFTLAMITAPLFWAYLSIYQAPNNIFDSIASNYWTFISLSIINPIVEEFIFRGLIQTKLLKHPMFITKVIGISLANFATSILFVLMHLLSHPPIWALLVFFPSLIFGHFRDKHTTITVPIILHCYYNAGYFALFGL